MALSLIRQMATLTSVLNMDCAISFTPTPSLSASLRPAVAGKALAEWVVYGGPEWDLWPLDRRRYTAYADGAYTTAKAIEVYQNEYASAYPNEEREASRPVKTSSLYARLKAKGAHFGARGGWERAIFFDVDGSVKEHTLSFRRPRSWRSAVAAEVKAVRERVGVLDLPGFTKFEVSGLGAEAFLMR